MFINSSIRRLIKSRRKAMSESGRRHSRHKSGMNLTDLGIGSSAKVRELCGNPIMAGRLKAMGIFPDTVIIKKSAIPAEGPIVIEKGSTQLAIGYHMAEKILVDPIQQKSL